MSANTDLLYTVTGLSGSQISGLVRKALAKREALQTEWVEKVTDHPPESLTGFLLATSTMFYLVERDVNPHIKTFVDALYYISTCLTVGYADLFPATQQGRLIASLVMTLGPALTNNVLDPPGRAVPASAQQQAAMLERLDAILAELRRQNVSS